MPKPKTLKIRISYELHGQLSDAYKALKRSKSKNQREPWLVAALLLQIEHALPREQAHQAPVLEPPVGSGG